MKLVLVSLMIIFSFQSFVFANENQCSLVEKQCDEAAHEDTYFYAQCLEEAAPSLKAFLHDWGLVCEGDENYCQIAKENCTEFVSSGDYDSLNQCLSVRASISCI